MSATQDSQATTVVTPDPLRIPHLLSALDRYFAQNPDKTLGQVISQFLPPGTDLTEVSDEHLTKCLRKSSTW